MMDAVTAYMTGQVRPAHGALLAAFQTESDAAVAAHNPAVDLPYGPSSREVFDFFRGDGAWQGTLAYFHAGYWQSRDKSQFRFLAPTFLGNGIDVAMINYPLCPDVSLPVLVEAARSAVPAVLQHAASIGRGGGALVASGHSAGGHLAVELALTDWTARGLPTSPVAGVVALSGVFDLEPLVLTPLNDRLRLNGATAQAMSPVHRVRGGMPAALFIVGGAETGAFLEQTAAMHAAWTRAGNSAAELVVEGADHFSRLRAMQLPDGPLARLLALF